MKSSMLVWLCALIAFNVSAQTKEQRLAPFFSPPEWQDQTGSYRSALLLKNGERVTTPDQWRQRRAEIRQTWDRIMGPWPPLIADPVFEIVRPAPQGQPQTVRLEIAPNQFQEVQFLVPEGNGPFPAAIVPYYETETSLGRSDQKLRDFALQLSRRGFVTLSIGSPGGDARHPYVGKATCQPLSFLAYVAANCLTALTKRPEVDGKRIGIVGHSYGGKWAMFASCLDDRFACAAWSDPGIVFDEARPNVNYWDPWYLGWEPDHVRPVGLISPENPRTGAYKTLVEEGHDLHELHALMAPRPFLVSGGSEDTAARWAALNHTVEVNRLLGFKNRVAMTNRPEHSPTEQSNEILYTFFEYFLKEQPPGPPSP